MSARVLIVEDEAIVAMDIALRLIGLGYTVSDYVSTGEEALEQAESFRPDLVMMDIRLAGGMDGIETAERLRDRHGMPILFVTAYSDDEVLKRALNVGACGFLLKPFDEAELEAAVNATLNG
ncbi:MAG: response regulator [Chloroflexi bacterium]|nr:response regulator [Chloroflexota bacterium]